MTKWFISQVAPDKGRVSTSKETDPLIFIKKNSQMNCCIGEKLNEFGDWSVDLPEPSWKQRLANKNSHPPPRKGSGCTGRNFCLKHTGCSRTRNLSRESRQASEYTSRTFSKGPLQLREGCPMWRTHNSSQEKQQNWLVGVGGCQEGCLADRDRHQGASSNPQGLSVTHCKSLVHRVGIHMGLIHKALRIPLTLTSVSNYRNSRFL